MRLVEYPVAILPFREHGKEVAGMGSQVANLLFARLVVEPSLLLVDREDLGKAFEEAELNLSGIVEPQQAIAIGQLTGARLIVTGTGFTVLDPEQGGLRQADYLMQGEGMSEFAIRHGNLISVKARIMACCCTPVMAMVGEPIGFPGTRVG